MKEDMVTMSAREIEWLRIVHKVMERRLTQVKAAEMMGVTDRQVRRILRKVQERGDRGIIHGNRGRPSSRRIPKEEEERIIGLVKKRYSDFGPTFASEKLLESEGVRIGREKLRQWMVAHGLWQVRSRKRWRIYQWRERKHHWGEMIQLDGSEHDWLEGRGPRLVLMGYLDDATNTFFGRFYEFEGVYSAMDSFRRYIAQYGIPYSVYLDRHSTYKTTREPNWEEALKGERAKTQFARALTELGVKLIYAHSPQAKGRIERDFGVLQDRLIKEMRLADIQTVDQANVFLETYLPRFNQRFARAPLSKENLHRPLPKDHFLEEIFCVKDNRSIARDYTVRWKHRIFRIQKPSITMRKQWVCVMEQFDGKITLRLNGRSLAFSEVTDKDLKASAKVEKLLFSRVRKNSPYIPPPTHPWRRKFLPLRRSLNPKNRTFSSGRKQDIFTWR